LTELRIGKRHLPHFVQARNATTPEISVLLKLRDGATAPGRLAASV
jgi:hypothetical protein